MKKLLSIMLVLLMVIAAPLSAFADEVDGNGPGEKPAKEEKADKPDREAEKEDREGEKAANKEERDAEKEMNKAEREVEKATTRAERLAAKVSRFEEKEKVEGREAAFEAKIEELEAVLARLEEFLGEDVVEDLEDEGTEGEGTEGEGTEGEGTEGEGTEGEGTEGEGAEEEGSEEEDPAVESAKALFMQYKAELKEAREGLQAQKAEAKELRKEIRELIEAEYSEEDMAEMNELIAQLQEDYEDIKILGIGNIISNGAEFKFDVPPVIKGGRTLIPVNAISKGFGADVAWDPEERKVTITKGEDVIEIWLDSNIAKVNGEEVTLDVEAEVIGSRTVVPLAFVAESLGLKVEWNPEDETIELEIEEEEETPTE